VASRSDKKSHFTSVGLQNKVTKKVGLTHCTVQAGLAFWAEWASICNPFVTRSNSCPRNWANRQDPALNPHHCRLDTHKRRKRDCGHPERICGGRGKSSAPALGTIPRDRIAAPSPTQSPPPPAPRHPRKANRPRVFHLGLSRASGALNLQGVTSEKPFEFSHGYRNVAGGAAYRDLPVRYLLT